MGAPWIRKYIPENIKDIVGQEEQLDILKTFIKNFKKQRKKAVLVHGASGCGKTASVYALGNELGLEVIELNASDLRNKDQINSVVGAASQQMSLFGRGKLILIDEMDGIAGRKDYGGIPALVKVIQDSSFPVIITANNPYDNKFSSIRNKSELLQFNELDVEDIVHILKRICEKEGIGYKEDLLKRIARRNGGDVRGAVNDMEIIAVSGEINRRGIDELSDRDRTENIINALNIIFKSKDASVAVKAFDTVDEDFDQRFFWLDENLPKEYLKAEDLVRAYDKLSRADVFRGRIRRWQHWRFLSYVNSLMTAGVAVSKDEKNKEFVSYKPTGRILKMWWAKRKNAKKKAIALKIAEKTHSSTRRVLQNIDYFKVMFKNNKEMGDRISEFLDLDREEVDWLRKQLK